MTRGRPGRRRWADAPATPVRAGQRPRSSACPVPAPLTVRTVGRVGRRSAVLRSAVLGVGWGDRRGEAAAHDPQRGGLAQFVLDGAELPFGVRIEVAVLRWPRWVG